MSELKRAAWITAAWIMSLVLLGIIFKVAVRLFMFGWRLV